MEYIQTQIGLLPKIGLGTFSVPDWALRELIPVALTLGCGIIDTAYKYHNEEVIGEILSERVGDRKDYYIETKANAELFLGNLRYLRLNKKSPETILRKSCIRLKSDYIDIFMLHSPFVGYENVIRKYQKIKSSGAIGLIGVCNLNLSRLQDLERMNLLPDLVQVEIHPYHSNNAVVEFCHSHSIVVEARSPFAHGDDFDEWKNEPVLQDLAKRYQATIPQVILRWITQRGIIALPRTQSTKHLEENIESFKLAFTEEEMDSISGLNRDMSYGYVSRR